MSWKELGVLFVLSAIWGASFLFIKLAVHDIPPMTLVGVRLLLAAIVLYAVMRASRLNLPRERHAWLGFILLGLVGLVVPFWLITWGEQHIPSSMAAIILATTPLINVLLTIFVMRSERLRGARVFGLFIGFVGVLVAVGLSLSEGSGLLGRLAVFGAAICYAVTPLYARATFRGMPALTLSTGQMITGAALSIPLALLLDPLPSAWPSSLALVSLLVLALICTALAYILFYWLLERVGATRSSLTTYLIPGFALFYGALLLAEPFNTRIALGLALIILGILIASDKLQLAALFGRKRQAL